MVTPPFEQTNSPSMLVVCILTLSGASPFPVQHIMPVSRLEVWSFLRVLQFSPFGAYCTVKTFKFLFRLITERNNCPCTVMFKFSFTLITERKQVLLCCEWVIWQSGLHIQYCYHSGNKQAFNASSPGALSEYFWIIKNTLCTCAWCKWTILTVIIIIITVTTIISITI